jgi:D-alanyl-D-alanine carboxypeptidase/D-alanyl-D-alanine-endopeptidase (penicillin-binding protein 4)
MLRDVWTYLMRTHGVRGRAVVVVVAALVAALGTVAAPASGQTLRERLDDALTVRGVSRAKTGAFAFDLKAGRVVYGWQGRRSFKPASNEKLGVALAALDRLGASYRIRTEVRGDGSRNGATWRGRLVLKGYGDPTLGAGDLRRLAAKLRAAGIRRVTGRIVGDETYFDARRMAPGWRASYYKIESPPLSALVVDRARVNGRTVDRPALAAAKAFRKALVAAGIAVGGKAATGPAPTGAPMFAVVRSRIVSALVRHMNKISDNFYAEMLVKHLGARLRDKGTTAAGCAVVRRVLDARNVPLARVRIADGSGLSRYDRATARAVAAILRSAWRDPALRDPFFSSLPIAGVDGTLEDRMRSGPAYGRVRAKTGTLNTASALSGYVGRRYVFSILQNDNPISWTRARLSQDRFAQALARTL